MVNIRAVGAPMWVLRGAAAALAVAVVLVSGMASPVSAGDGRSITISDLSACFVGDRYHIAGLVPISDDSESGRRKDGIDIVIESFDVDWEFKQGRRDPYENSDPNGPAGGSFDVHGTAIAYSCEYTVVEDDNNPNDEGEDPNQDTVDFDEKITVEYVCWFEAAIPQDGFLRGTADVMIADRDKLFSFSSDYPLDGRKSLSLCDG